MSKQRILKALKEIGLSETDAQIYLHLSLNGPHKAREITKNVNLNKEQIYRSLRKLQNKDIVNATIEHPAVFSAIPFENVLDLITEAKKEQEKALREVREELLSSWQKMIKKNSKNN